MASPIEVNVNPYVRSHGKAPCGHGTWWFEILNYQYCYQSHYGSAVAAAKKEARQLYRKVGINRGPAVVLLP